MNPKKSACLAGSRRVASRAAFTLIEIMVSMAILGLIMVMLFSIFDQVNKAWLNSENRVETFTQARAILDLMSRELSQAVATPKISFHGENNAIYFVAPVNTDAGGLADLCEVGYVFDTTQFTFTRRLTQSDKAAWDFYANTSWWGTFDAGKDTLLADDTILNVTFQYSDSAGNAITPPFTATKLPYSVQISVDAIDSRAATRLKLVGGGSIPTGLTTPGGASIRNSALRSFFTTVYFPAVSP